MKEITINQEDAAPRLDYEITPTALVYGGDALARLPDGRAVFTPFVLPGERARVRIIDEKRGHLRALPVSLIEPSPMRIEPPCVHFGMCGGCHYQHISYTRQLEFKRQILTEQLERLGGLQNPPVRPALPAHQEYGYRNNIQFHLSPAGRLAYQGAGAGNLVEISMCLLPEHSLSEVWPALDFEPGAPIVRVGLRSGAGDEVLLSLEGSQPAAPAFETSLPVSAVYTSPGGQVLLAGSDALIMEVLGRPFQVSAGSFFQVNTNMAGRLVQELLARLPLTSGSTLLELYCGVGLFSAFLAPRTARLVGIELSESACRDFAVNLDEFDHVELYQGSAGEILPHLDFQPDLVLADPPRSGLERQVLDALLRMLPPNLAYISCDPATLARDLKRLTAGGYQLLEVIPFDLFPQTYHIESLALLARNSPG